MAGKKEESDLPETNDTDEIFDKGTNKSKVNKTNKKGNDPKPDEDEELSKLLDNSITFVIGGGGGHETFKGALEDFALSKKTDDNNEPKEREETVKPIPPNSLWDEEFLKQTAERFQQSFQSGFSAGDTPLTAEQLGQNLQSLAEAVTQMTSGAEASPDAEFSNFFAQALKQFSESPQGAQRPFSEDDFRSMMSNLNNCLESPELNELFPFLISIFQNLLSKEVLYGDLKGVIEKYPQWLEDNKAKLLTHEYDRHVKKLEILQDVCSELEKESPNDTEEVKKARCDHILMLMLQVQELGPMPAEIAGDLDPILGLDSHGNPQLPTNMSPNQCSLM